MENGRGKSRPSRASRIASPAMARALVIRAGMGRGAGCDQPAWMSHDRGALVADSATWRSRYANGLDPLYLMCSGTRAENAAATRANG